jgi:lysophospholipase L1-like esterase
VVLLGLGNLAVLAALLIPIELIFGNWIRPMTLADLKRFSIPIGVAFETDVSAIYTGGPRNPIRYSRDQYGLRGNYQSLADIDVLTVGGSTTDQRFLDDQATWQSVAERELAQGGHPLVFANAGVDGQSTVGAAFSFQHWFPLLDGLKPSAILFYLGTNDVLRRPERVQFDASLDATSWRVRSVIYQLYRTLRGNMQARNVGVVHGRRPNLTAADFTDQGLLSAEERSALSDQITQNLLFNVERLREHVKASGAQTIIVTQTAFAWNADSAPPRGVKGVVQAHDRSMNYADVAFLHQAVNRALVDYCAKNNVICLDVANDVKFDADDYYDYLHNTPKGAEKIGRYLAERLSALDLGPKSGVQK